MDREPYPLNYTDGGGTRWVVVEPGHLIDRHWYGPGPLDFHDRYTEAGFVWLHPGAAIGVVAPAPIGSRFD